MHHGCICLYLDTIIYCVEKMHVNEPNFLHAIFLLLLLFLGSNLGDSHFMFTPYFDQIHIYAFK